LITTFEYGYKATSSGTAVLPVIKGENTNVSITVQNAGYDYNQFNVTLYVNNSIAQTWTTSVLGVNKTQPFTWGKGAMSIGYYNLTVIASGGGASPVTESKLLAVVGTPSLVIVWSPASPVAGDKVIINGSGSIFNDPRGKITSYTWRIFGPGVPTSAAANATLSGAVVNYTLSKAGNWTVILTVVGSVAGYTLTYNTKRGSTSAYQKTVAISVASSGTSGLSIELVIGIIIVVIIVIIIAVSLIRRRRRKTSKPRA
jgi:hypothetical protein